MYIHRMLRHREVIIDIEFQILYKGINLSLYKLYRICSVLGKLCKYRVTKQCMQNNDLVADMNLS